MTDTKNKRGFTTTDTTDIKRKIKEYHEQLYATFDNLRPWNGPIPWKTKSAKIHTRRDNLNRTISIKEIGLTINNFPKQKAESKCRWVH